MRTFRWNAPIIIGAGALAILLMAPAPLPASAGESGAEVAGAADGQQPGLSELKSHLDNSDRKAAVQALELALSELADGVTLIANGSRSALPAFAAAYPRLKVVLITARPDILAARLAARGRESADAIARRLDRAVPEIVVAADTVVIDNSGPLEEAGEAFVSVLASALARGD